MKQGYCKYLGVTDANYSLVVVVKTKTIHETRTSMLDNVYLNVFLPNNGLCS